MLDKPQGMNDIGPVLSPDTGKSTLVVSNRGSHEDLPREHKGLTQGTFSSSMVNNVDMVFPRDKGKPTLGCGYRRGDVDNLLEHQSLARCCL